MRFRSSIASLVSHSFIVLSFLSLQSLISLIVKLINELDRWDNKQIPRFLSSVYHDFIVEESWTFLKTFKDPTINYKTLRAVVYHQTKNRLKELQSA